MCLPFANTDDFFFSFDFGFSSLGYDYWRKCAPRWTAVSHSTSCAFLKGFVFGGNRSIEVYQWHGTRRLEFLMRKPLQPRNNLVLIDWLAHFFRNLRASSLYAPPPSVITCHETPVELLFHVTCSSFFDELVLQHTADRGANFLPITAHGAEYNDGSIYYYCL